jgi:predicted lactoylglutathione lyase
VFHRVTVRAADREAPERFYATVLETLGIRVQMAFRAPDAATVEAFHRAATEGGYRDGGGPGERGGSYGACILDTDGNTAELVFNHNRE